MERITRKYKSNPIIPNEFKKVIPKRHENLFKLIEITDVMMEEGYDFVKPIYHVTEFKSEGMGFGGVRGSNTTRLNKYIANHQQETFYYEALMTKNPN